MANHPSALKRMRQSEKKRLRNMAYRSRIRTAVKKFLRAAGEQSAEAGQLLRLATSLRQKGVSKGIVNHYAASSTISRRFKRLPA